jgi:hypothetical protein
MEPILFQRLLRGSWHDCSEVPPTCPLREPPMLPPREPEAAQQREILATPVPAPPPKRRSNPNKAPPPSQRRDRVAHSLLRTTHRERLQRFKRPRRFFSHWFRCQASISRSCDTSDFRYLVADPSFAPVFISNGIETTLVYKATSDPDALSFDEVTEVVRR